MEKISEYNVYGPFQESNGCYNRSCIITGVINITLVSFSRFFNGYSCFLEHLRLHPAEKS